MKTIDVHGLGVDEAIERIVSLYNHQVEHGQRERISIVHGYGSSGVGGVLRLKIRDFLKRRQMEFLCGELVDNNPGHTILFPGTRTCKKGRKSGERKLRGGIGS